MNKTIKDISLEIGSGITPLRSNELYWNSPDIPWIKTEQLGQYRIFDSMEYISDFALEDTNIRLWSPHTVSVAMYGEGKTRGNVSILMIETTTNQACCNIKVNDALADYRFLYYWLKNNYENLRALSAGVRKNLNSDDIKNFPFPENSLSEQEKIADILSVVDDKIELNSKICSELEAMAKTLYDYWFVQFDFPDENGKPYRTSGGEMVWNEQLKREIPKGWEISTIGKTIDKIPNTARIPSSEYLRDGSIPVIDQSSDFIAGYTNNPDSVLKSKSGYIVFGDHTRIVKYIRFPFARGADGTQVLKSNNPCIPEELFYQMIKSIDLSNYGYARHFKFLKDTLIVIPEKNISGNFAEITKPIYEKQAKLVFENIELSKLRDWLLPMLMNGQARVE